MGNNHFENVRIKNLICRLNVCAPDWGEKDCIYGYHKFYYFQGGEGTILIQGDEYLPKAGELFMIPANTKHTYWHNPQKPVYKYWCHFDLSLADGHKLKYVKGRALCCPPANETRALFDQLTRLDRSLNPLDTLAEKAALLTLLKLFIEQALKPFEDIEILLENSEGFASQMNAYILKHLHEPITLKQLADLVHLHPNYFIQYFRKHFFVSPIEYVYTVKLLVAAQLLLEYPQKSISQIAYETGFNDYRYFSRLFKRKYGIAPSAYRDI